jgi:hypothetical protein
MSDDFITLVYMLVYGMFIGVCLLCFGAVLTSSLLSVTQRALTSKALRRLFDPNHRPEVERKLANGDAEALKALLMGLEPSLPLTSGERKQVVEVVGQLKVKEAAQPLIQLLKGLPMWEDVKAKAIWALGEIGDEQVVPEIVPYLGEFNYTPIRAEALDALHKLGWGEFADAFNRVMLGNEDALTVLREKYRQEAVKAFVRALWAGKPSVAITAAKALGKLNAVEALGELKRRSSIFMSPKEVREVCREVARQLQQIAYLPSPASSEIDISTLPRPADPLAFRTDTLPSPSQPPSEQLKEP